LRTLITIGVAIIITALGAPAMAAAPSVLVAHRGLSDAAQVKYQIPEHSLKAYQWAVDQGAKVVDFDLQYTADGLLVDIHNSTLNETTNVSDSRPQYVKNWTLSNIKKLWLELPQDKDGNGNDDNTDQHPVSGNQALNFLVSHPGISATVETKGSWSQSRMNRLRDIVKSKGLTNRVILHSFNLDHVKWAKAAGFPLRGYVVDGTPPSASTVKQYATYVFVPLSKLTAELARQYQAAGIKVAVWTLDNTTEYDAALAKGADIWICNDVAEARDYLQKAS
jgi:glycerophosphoryl diester phosphodiesterase